MLQDKADKDMVEGLRSKGQGEDVRLLELHIGEFCRSRSPSGFSQRIGGDIQRDKLRLRAPLGESDSLGPNATPSFEDDASRRIGGIGVQEID